MWVVTFFCSKLLFARVAQAMLWDKCRIYKQYVRKLVLLETLEGKFTLFHVIVKELRSWNMFKLESYTYITTVEFTTFNAHWNFPLKLMLQVELSFVDGSKNGISPAFVSSYPIKPQSESFQGNISVCTVGLFTGRGISTLTWSQLQIIWISRSYLKIIETSHWSGLFCR